MNRLLQRIFYCILLSALLAGCRKKAFDDYYGRPENLAPPIYQQLTARGNFKTLLAVVDKAGYKDILAGAGSFTMFAPNDAAFQKYFTDRGISGVDQIDSATARQIVSFSLVYNAFLRTRLNDYQANSGWLAGQAFRRRTAYYRGFYNDTAWSGTPYTALASNRNGGFVFGDNNNKYTTYFTDTYFSGHNLTASDYNFFYPSTTFKGFQVADATVVNQDIVAENGYIHEIDRVVLPQPTIDQYLASNPQYSEFRKLLAKYLTAFNPNNDATNRYQLLTGGKSSVYIKTFNSLLGFSPNNENYLKTQDNDGQTNGYTLFVPKNDVLLNYINTVLLENYSSLDAMPTQIIVDFVNAHMWQSSVWPSKFASMNNVQGEPAKFTASTDIIDKQVLSNGFFYGTNKVQLANVFTTVYGRPYLDPKYLLMTRALDLNYRYTITIPTLRFTVIMMSDSLLNKRGFGFDSRRNDWTYVAPGADSSTIVYSPTARDNLQRILATHIVPTPNNELDNISGSGIVETLNGEYIKYNNGTFISAGSQDSGYVVTTNGTRTSSNGRVYYADKLLTYSTKPLASSILALGTATTSEFYSFAQFLKNATIYNASNNSILGVSLGVFYTAFIPNNAAIQAAVTAGLLPKTGTGTPNYTPTVQADKDLVNNFILYHLLNKTTVVPDGKKNGTYETLYKKLSGDAGQIIVSNLPGSMKITDAFARTANVITASGNNLADRCVIHLIDNYLQYNPN
ncbi:MAG: fasciclin domain-containing protein [Bacteroidetes bacterium]|nr:fasciclin domain-containing protein [Bacteroidota bacterium]